MWFDGKRKPNTIYVASISRGKDSTAMLRAIQLMGWPLDAIVSVDVWFDAETPAELPPMVAFKDEYDKKVLDWFGVPVKRLCARSKAGKRKTSYCDIFYRKRGAPQEDGSIIYGFPIIKGNWCTGELKKEAMSSRRVNAAIATLLPKKQKNNVVKYIGIAADEPLRIARHMTKKDLVLPLVQIGWDEDLCGLETTYMGMLSPTYTDGGRDGCWFCHNQGINQLRRLRKNYPELWEKLMQLDLDSPVTFHADGHTVHDFDRRFELEDAGLVNPNERWKWSILEEELNYRWF